MELIKRFSRAFYQLTGKFFPLLLRSQLIFHWMASVVRPRKRDAEEEPSRRGLIDWNRQTVLAFDNQPQSNSHRAERLSSTEWRRQDDERLIIYQTSNGSDSDGWFSTADATAPSLVPTSFIGRIVTFARLLFHLHKARSFPSPLQNSFLSSRRHCRHEHNSRVSTMYPCSEHTPS